MSWSDEIRHALAGALSLASLDRGGMKHFDLSADGFWRSFAAIAFGVPFFLVLLFLGETMAPGAAGAGAVLELLAYGISWIGFLLLLIPFSRAAGLSHNYAAFVVAFNWCQLLVIVAMVPILGLAAADILPGGTIGFILIGFAVAALGYLWFIARVALGASPLLAIAVVALDFLFTEVVHETFRRLAQLIP
jgi:hypothetical protein